MTVFAVLLNDRHFDEVLTIHANRVSAEKRVAEIKAGYERVENWRWSDRSKTWLSHDDGPTIRMVEMEVQP